jgi:hypothetical protein
METLTNRNMIDRYLSQVLVRVYVKKGTGNLAIGILCSLDVELSLAASRA